MMYLYGARDKITGKLVSNITNPRHKFWEKRGTCEKAIIRSRRKENLELVTFQLIEVKEEKK
ncbi:hypothetical protein [Caproicibacterium amylolyticum]|uniref:Uncharacterized protein n=1 Tax=Caproicibacterium amylolyticum TaxID=2766537 RepID=A0A7G9WJX1_9FIRM|nr:hypothetical protein [Caproicibacterium amylolyticum]QNO18983.1 hypothetical protein H6X83_04995 [Caproicibacterium amylolyticum]